MRCNSMPCHAMHARLTRGSESPTNATANHCQHCQHYRRQCQRWRRRRQQQQPHVSHANKADRSCRSSSTAHVRVVLLVLNGFQRHVGRMHLQQPEPASPSRLYARLLCPSVVELGTLSFQPPIHPAPSRIHPGVCAPRRQWIRLASGCSIRFQLMKSPCILSTASPA